MSFHIHDFFLTITDVKWQFSCGVEHQNFMHLVLHIKEITTVYLFISFARYKSNSTSRIVSQIYKNAKITYQNIV